MNEFRKLFHFIRPYWNIALFALVMLITMVALDLAIPRLIGILIDQGIRQKNLQVVISTSMLMLSISLLSALVAVLNNNASIRVGEQIARDLREELFVRIQRFSFGDIDRFPTGTLLVRLTSDTAAVQRLFQISLRIGTRAPLSMLGSIILMVVTSKTLALAIMPLFVAAGLVIWFFSTRLEPLFRAVQQRLDRLNTVLQENIAGVRLIRSFAQTARESRRFHDANDALAEGNEVVMRRMAIMNPLLTLLINIGIVLIVWVGGNHAIEESASASLSLGQIVAFSNYLMATLHPVLLMIQLSNTWANGLASAARINEVLDTIPAVQESNEAFPLPDSAQGKVEFNHVSFHYHGKTDGAVLEDICALVKPGMTVAILGATGSGKSSLVNLVPRFYDPSEGSVLVDGADVRTLKLSSLRGHIALVPQETILFSGSVRENLKFGNPQASEDDMIVAAKAAQAHDFITRLPQGYDTHIEERGVNLSGGQKQRIAIARALLCKPKILILDDGTSAVDVETETHIHSAIASWTKGLTVLLVAQRVSTVLNADHIIVLDEGRIVGEGTHRQLYAHNPVYREICNSQLGAGVRHG